MKNIFCIATVYVALVLFGVTAKSALCANSAHRPLDFNWREIGPGEGGWMYGVTISPEDSKTVIAGLDMGNGFITRDGGTRWSVLGQSGAIPLGQPGYRGFNCAAFDPQSSKTVWVGSTHGIFKSSDSGRTWKLSHGGDPSQSVGAIAVDPDQSKVVYAGAGQYGDGSPGWLKGQVWKTVNGGVTWHEAGRPGGPWENDPAKTRAWHRILIDPKSSSLPGRGHSRVYIIGSGGLFVSNDAGENWTSLDAMLPGGMVHLNPDNPSSPMSSASDLVIVPPSRNTARGQSALLLSVRVRYADASHSKVLGGVYRSDDGGHTWAESQSGLGDSLRSIVDQGEGTYLYLSNCASHPNRVYMCSFRNVFGSTDSGISWKQLTKSDTDWTPVTDSFGTTGHWNLAVKNADGSGGSAYGISSIAVAPTDPNEIAFTASGGVTMSINGGRTWASAMNDFGAAVHPKMFGNRPPMRATNLQRGRGEQLIVARNLAIDPFNANNIAIAYDDLGPEISRDGGVWWEWSWMGVGLGERDDADAIAYDPRRRGHLYLGCDDRPGPSRHIYESDNGGHTFRAIGLSQLADAADQHKPTATDALLIDQSGSGSQAVLYAGTSVGLFKTANDGQTWQDVSGPMAGLSIHRLAQDSKHLNRIFAGVRNPRKSGQGGLYRTDDSGSHWIRLAPDKLGDIQSLSVCSAHPNVIVVVAGPPSGDGGSDWQAFRAWRSSDGGDTWALLDNRRAAFAAVSPIDQTTLYLCTWAKDVQTEIVGLWVSRDSGKTWAGANKNLSLALAGQGDQIVFDPRNPHRLFLIQESGVYVGYDNGADMHK